jgi:hypothetical protein
MAGKMYVVMDTAQLTYIVHSLSCLRFSFLWVVRQCVIIWNILKKNYISKYFISNIKFTGRRVFFIYISNDNNKFFIFYVDVLIRSLTKVLLFKKILIFFSMSGIRSEMFDPMSFTSRE